jgi:FkbM family methyltransferase
MGTSNFLGALKRLYRHVRRGQTKREPIWRTVEHAPLKGLQFLLPSGEGAGWADRFLQGQYEIEMLVTLEGLARRGGVLYDIGAHMGFYTCAWLALGGDRVEAFEPAPFNVRTLQANLARNDYTGRVRVHTLALGNENRHGSLIASEADIGAASASYVAHLGYVDWPPGSAAHTLPNSHPVTVNVRRLDDLIFEEKLPMPTVVKIDVEGAEAAVLSGAERVLAEHLPVILCELHNIDAALQAADQLARLGYEQRMLGKNGAQPACMWLPHGSRVDV